MEIKTSYQIRDDLPFLYDEEEANTKWVSVESLKKRLEKEIYHKEPFNEIDFPTYASIFQDIINELEERE